MLQIPLAASESVCSFSGRFPEADGIPLGHHSLPLAHATEACSLARPVCWAAWTVPGGQTSPQAGCMGGSLPVAQMDHTEVCLCSLSEHCWWERRALSVGGPTKCSGPCSWPGSALHTVSKVQSLVSWLKSPEKLFYLPPRVSEPLGDRLTSQLHMQERSAHSGRMWAALPPGHSRGLNDSRHQLPAQ